MFQDPNDATNPYQQTADQDQNFLTSMQNGAGYKAPTPMQYQYPSYPNQFGLGTQNPNSGLTGGESGRAFAQGPITVNTPDTSSRGSNPWSFLGEANARDVPPPVGHEQG